MEFAGFAKKVLVLGHTCLEIGGIEHKNTIDRQRNRPVAWATERPNQDDNPVDDGQHR